MLQDARFGLRQLMRAPMVAVVAIGTLAIGIGLNSAVFSLVHAVLIRPLPYPDAERIVWVTPFHERTANDTNVSPGDYRIWKQQTQLFARMTGYGTQDLSLMAGAEASQERIGSIAGDFWAITGARPLLGRLIAVEDQPQDDQHSVVLSYGLFQRRFGGQASILGRSIDISGTAFTIVGILPQGYRVTFPQQTVPGDELRDIDAFIALPRGQERPGRPIVSVASRPAPPWMRVVGVLQPGVSVTRARAEMEALFAAMQRDFPRPEALLRTLRLLPLQEKLSENVRLSLLVLQGAVGFVLLIAIANVANLLLAQASLRTRETAIRAALGASRRRLVLQFLVESIVLALIAGSAGVLVAYAAVPLLVSLAPVTMTSLAHIDVDSTVLIFTLLLSVLTAILFAWAPVFETSRVSLSTTLGGTQSSIAGGGTRAQGLLISLEVALAVLLLTAAGLMVKSLMRLHEHPNGFTPEDTYVMRIPLSGPRYEELGQKHAYLATLLERLEQTAGVEATGLAGATYHTPVIVSGAPAADPAAPPPTAAVRMVSPGYLRAMGVSLVRGRWPANAEALDVVVVNETFAKRIVPGGDPIGRTIGGSFLTGTIVGIVSDHTQASLDAAAMPELYYPYQRSPAMFSVQVAVRMSDAVVPDVRRLIEGIDRTQPVYQFQNLEQLLADSIAPRRFNMFLLQVYAAAAAIMALAGTFGVVSRTVSRRTRESAVRIAIGARPAAVVAMIVRQAMVYVLVGVAVGVAATLAAGEVLRGLLYGIEPNDPMTLAAIALSLTTASFLACCLPATRAARVDPVVALREE